MVSIAAAAGARRIAAADSTGSIHVRHLSDLKGGFELTGYPDAIRHLGMSPVGDFVVAGSDDELSWWHIDDEGVIRRRRNAVSGTTPRLLAVTLEQRVLSQLAMPTVS